MIFVECNVDFTLVKSLGVSKKEITHSHCKGNVCNKLRKSNKSKGMVDDDPGAAQPSYIKQLELKTNIYGIKLLLDRKNGNLLIVLCPRLEEWVLKVARDEGVDVSDYNLPNNADQLHKVINSKLRDFENLLSSLKAANSDALLALENFIKGPLEDNPNFS